MRQCRLGSLGVLRCAGHGCSSAATMALDDGIDGRVSHVASLLGVGQPSDPTGRFLNDNRGSTSHTPAGKTARAVLHGGPLNPC